MCGLVGGFWRNGSLNIIPNFEGALDALRFRGPNDRGVEFFDFLGCRVGLGHTRLSVLDLSSAGHQPMSSQDGRYLLIFNGEIYNYLELKQELVKLGHSFRSNSDTEVLLAAWAAWGKACLDRLQGMFAFALLDRHSKLLTCVRDAFGIKPFFYTQGNENFFFASELPAIKALRSGDLKLDWQRAYDYLVHGDYDSGRRSFVEGVSHLLPGHFIEVDLSNGMVSEQNKWWSPKIAERQDLKFSQAVELVRESFLTNIRRHLRSDVPLGAALSGGIDSSSVVCAMRFVEPNLPIQTFSYIARGSSLSEEQWVDRVNDYVGAQAHKVSVEADDLLYDLDELIRVQGEPFGSTSIYAQYRVYRLAREHGVTVTLDGQGADEMLAGYNGYPGQRLRSLLERGHISEAFRFLNEWSQWPGRSRMAGLKRAVAEMTNGGLNAFLRNLNGMRDTPPWINAKLLESHGVLTQFSRGSFDGNVTGRRVAAELAFSLTERGLPALLRHGDRNSMRFSVESRVPFLTTSLVDLLLSLPEEYLISAKGETKHVFRAAMRDIVPDDILDRRDKIGFATPEQDWLKSSASKFRAWLKEDLQVPFFHQNEVLKEFEQIIAGDRPFSWQVWRWINFSRWYIQFFA